MAALFVVQRHRCGVNVVAVRWLRSVLLGIAVLIVTAALPAMAQQGPIDWHAAVVGDAKSIPQPDACPGCCSSHGGISSSCASNGRILCRDGTASPTCSCASCGVSQTPTCTGGRYWNGTACVCPSGQSFINGQCQLPTPTCTGGQIWNGTACACPSGQTLVNGQCRVPTPTCTGGQVWNGSACACPSGQTLVNGQCSTPTPTCAGGQSWNGSACVCPAGQVLNNGQCAAANAFVIQPGISGNWFNPSESGHGFQFEVLGEPPSLMTVFWFTFDNAGNGVWISGAGTFQGNRFVVDAARRMGGRFPPNFNSSALTALAWGRLTFTFRDCTHARVEWVSTDPGFTASGGMELEQLTRVSGVGCG